MKPRTGSTRIQYDCQGSFGQSCCINETNEIVMVSSIYEVFRHVLQFYQYESVGGRLRLSYSV